MNPLKQGLRSLSTRVFLIHQTTQCKKDESIKTRIEIYLLCESSTSLHDRRFTVLLYGTNYVLQSEYSEVRTMEQHSAKKPVWEKENRNITQITKQQGDLS